MKKTEAELAAEKFLKGTHPVLYILMRSDLDSLNPGKAMAQASHASNAMVHKASQSKNKHVQKMLKKWQTETTQGFGTCLVLDCHDEVNMIEILGEFAERKCDIVGEIVNDPSYPIRDSEITHYISLNTCAYIFGDKNDEEISMVLEKFSLYK